MKNVNEGKTIHECTSCGGCAAVCPTNAIQIKLNKDGFYRPEIDNTKCIQCGLCQKVCYKYGEVIDSDEKNIKVYSGYTKDEELLRTSTSGGIATIIAGKLIDSGYYVAGVIYDYEKNIAISKIAKNKEELEAFKGSKYIQSYTQETFRKILKDNTEQKYAIIGLPCHIYAINQYTKIKNNREKYIFIDLFCHGCPSMNLWNKYVKYVQEAEKMSHFNNINFRSKVKGWHQFNITFEEGKRQYYASKRKNYFYDLFFSDQILNDSCSECKIRSTLAYTDIRLGDFWAEKYDTNTKGVSLIAIASKKGEDIWKKIEKEIYSKEENEEDIKNGQSYGKDYNINKNLRKNMLQYLEKDEINIKKVWKYYLKNMTLKEKIKYRLKLIISFLPQSITAYMRKIYHKNRKG